LVQFQAELTVKKMENRETLTALEEVKAVTVKLQEVG
jgi:hypothetical protein